MLQEQLKSWGRRQNFGALYQTDYSYSFIVEHSSPQENILLKTGHKASFQLQIYYQVHKSPYYSVVLYAEKFCAVWAGGYKYYEGKRDPNTHTRNFPSNLNIFKHFFCEGMR